MDPLETRDLAPMTASDMLWVAIPCIIAATLFLAAVLAVLRTDHTAICDGHAAAECAAYLGDG